MNSPPKTTRLESEALVQRGVTHHAGNITPTLEAFVSNRELPELCLQSRTGVSPIVNSILELSPIEEKPRLYLLRTEEAIFNRACFILCAFFQS